MSKDIRSFFTVKNSKTSLKNNDQSIKSNHKTGQKKRPIIIDSDEDEKSPVKNKRSKPLVEDKKQNNQKKQEVPATKSKYFECQHDFKDLFGSAPVKRDNSRKIIKRVITKEPQEFHIDEDFEAELAKLDDIWSEEICKEGDKKVDAKQQHVNTFNESPKKRDVVETQNGIIKSPRKRKAAIDHYLSPEKKIRPTPDDNNECVKATKQDDHKKESPIKNLMSKYSSPTKSPTRKSPRKEKTPDKSPYKKLSITKIGSETAKDEKSTKIGLLNLKNSNAKQDTTQSEIPSISQNKLSPKTNDYVKLGEKIEQKNISRKETVDRTDNESIGSSVKVEATSTLSSGPSNLWVERYKPTATKQIIGQHGEKSCVNKLIHWLNNWEKNQSGTKKLVKPSPWAKNDDGAFFKAALLSGPPGVGKTTSAHLVCKELGFDIVEFNASDTRSKRLLHEEVSELLSTKSLSPFFTGKGDQVTKKHVLLMDEVDGMAGNEDRGGVQELISLIKQSRVPVICMCNDRNHPKIRSLSNYCFDLRFIKPRVEQIRGAMMSVCFKEKLKIKPEELTDIITSANQDIRLIMNHLSMLSVQKTSMANSSKHIKLGPWDIVKKIFSEQDHQAMSIHDKCDLFFHDYNITPLFVQENYLNAVPHKPEGKNKIKKMQLFAKAATSLSYGDLTEKSIRSNNAWGLLPVQAIFSSLVPGEVLEGHLGAQINFPAWFGKNSRQTKMNRLVQELTVHSRLKISGNREAMNLDYVSSLGSAITGPLLRDGTDGVSTALGILSEYCLVREDLESITELSTWPGGKNQFSAVDSKVKAAFTRAYNKTSAPTPYAAVPIKKGRGDVDNSDGLGEEEECAAPDLEDEEEEGLEGDAMIMVKKKPAGKKADKEVQPSTSKGSKTSKRGKKK
ncbi:replication factor C subunit 1 [Macrosteles quadrilineatus]|uniref:replication factor C subunit 1 n=1 Tax=Macrosteles quadrilineatus TaxID=74068 RepID=UPI0023E318A5|nr:replication factor C subunit 1 [Macrosteles quadrilineatus]